MDAVSILSAFEKNRKLIFVLLLAFTSLKASAQGCNCPPVASCSPCQGGLTNMTLRYNGILLPALVTVTEGGGSVVFNQLVNPGASFSFTGSLPGEKFVGNQIIISVTVIPNAIIDTSCGSTVFVNSDFGSFTVLAAASKNGGPICCSAADNDSEPPVIFNCPSNITKSADDGSCSTQVTWNPPILAADNCGSVSLSGSHNSGSVFPFGVTTVTYTATDGYGNMSQCEFDVEVVDTTPPVINGCPSKITISANATCAAVVNWTAPTAVDNCSTATLVSDHNPGEAFPLGTTTVTYTATDAAGNSSQCLFDVEVRDTTPPVITGCPSNISLSANALCQATATWTAPTAIDNCSVSMTTSHTPGSTFPIGTTTVTYTATDGAGNKRTCSFNVIVTDNTPPAITGCPGNRTVNANGSCLAVVTWTPPLATDNCTVSLTSTHSPGSTFPLGLTKVTYTAIDGAGNKTLCEFNVTVVDNVPPAFTSCPSSINIFADASCKGVASWTLPVATDNCSVIVTSNHIPGETFPIGITNVTYTATDGAGLTATCSFNVIVNDNSPPEFTCSIPDIIVTADESCSTTATWIPPTVNDCSIITSISSTSQPGNVFPIGTTTVTYTATDAFANSSTCSFNVIVEDKVPPVFTLCPTTDIIINTNECDAVVTWTRPQATDNCNDDVIITSTHNPDEIFSPGTTEVIYTATDNSGNISECRFNVVVRSNLTPVITGCPTEIYAEADITAKVAVTWTDPSVTFNCDDGVLSSNYNSGDEFQVGTTVVEYTARDASGNQAVCSFNVVVEFGAPVFEVIQVVTPNGDGINDDWTISNLQYFSDNSVMVVDRWGSLIYQATGYNNQSIVWKGVNSSGTLVPTGTYFYTIVVDWEGKHVEKRGFIEVVQ